METGFKMAKNSMIFKLIIFLFLFVIVVFTVIFLLIVPSIKELKATRYEYKKVYNRLEYANKELEAKQKDLKDIKHQTLKISKAFENRFEESDFLKFSKKYFKEATLKKDGNETYKKSFKEYKFTTISKISDPTVFYRFLTDINRYDNIIQADFPIKMAAYKDDINTTFTLKVYTLLKH